MPGDDGCDWVGIDVYSTPYDDNDLNNALMNLVQNPSVMVQVTLDIEQWCRGHWFVLVLVLPTALLFDWVLLRRRASWKAF